jgi:hypothetical protein
MVDENLAELERQVEANPDDLELRVKLYRGLVRVGQVTEKGIQFAEAHGDPTAKIIASDGVGSARIESDEDLALLGNLPIQSLDLSACKGKSDEGLKQLCLSEPGRFALHFEGASDLIARERRV